MFYSTGSNNSLSGIASLPVLDNSLNSTGDANTVIRTIGNVFSSYKHINTYILYFIHTNTIIILT